MDIKIAKSDLNKALSHAQSVVERRTTVPILSHILLEARDENLKLTATDLEISIIEKIPAEVILPGRLAVPAHLFYDITRKLPDDAVISIQVNPEGALPTAGHAESQPVLFVKSGRARFKLPFLPAEDFPTINIGDLPCQFSLSSDKWRCLIEKTRFAMSNEETRYNLNGIYFHVFEGKELRAVATDGHRLAQVSLPLPDGADKLPGIIISRKTINELLRLLNDGEMVAVAVSEIQVTFKFKDVVLISRLIDGTFPDYAGVIPTHNDKCFVVDVKPFSQAVDRVSTITYERSPEVKLELENGKVTLSAQNADSGLAQEEVEVNYHQDQIQMGFNARYLLDVTHQIDSQEAEFSFSDAVSPVLIKDRGQGNSLFVVMPLRS